MHITLLLAWAFDRQQTRNIMYSMPILMCYFSSFRSWKKTSYLWVQDNELLCFFELPEQCVIQVLIIFIILNTLITFCPGQEWWILYLVLLLVLNPLHGEGNGTPLPYSCLENPMDGEPGGLQSMGLLRVGHDWATSLSCIEEVNGNSLQCSCLKNPRDGGAWWAAVYGTRTESDTTEVT